MGLADNIFKQIKKKRSFLCVGLDLEIEKIPEVLRSNGFQGYLEFNKRIIDATIDLAVAYKPNTAFYEALGDMGWVLLKETVEHIRKLDREVFIICDAKRGDIGNTSEKYAKAFFEEMSFDACTLSPYMGKDTVVPFLNYENRASILLALTSNESAKDLQFLKMEDGEMLYEKTLRECVKWGDENQIMFVIGATKGEFFKRVREIVPNNFLLVPGIGAQGGSLREVVEYGLNSKCGLLVNSSRGILYAGGVYSRDINLDVSLEDSTIFDCMSRKEALKLQREMSSILEEKGLL